MNAIFISYRRDDGPDTAQLLQMHLMKMFGEDAVFLDTITMKPGDEFPIELHNAVINSKVVIAMIGKNWKGNDPYENRLDRENDWVRKELELALEDKKKKIFPVLIKGASKTISFEGLPVSIKRIATLNVLELREKEFKTDLLPLIPLVEPYLELEDPLKDLPLDEDRYVYPPGSPFKGLDYFTEKDAKLFFGRGEEIRKLYNKTKNRNILFLYGQSGSGKSSILFAGLKPRMENRGWKLEYFRRESGNNLSELLDNYILRINESSKELVILDQVEEIFTNPNINISFEAEAQQLLTSVRNASEKIHVLLSFRKEYLAEIKKLFTGLTIEEIYLEPLQTKGVLEAIRGVTKSDEAKDTYELEFSDDEVPMAIAQSVLSDEESDVAPLLQVILRKMWDNVENKKPRIFSKELLEEVKSSNLITFISDQISALKEKFEKEVENGLVLDVLHFFTTLRGTSASYATDELINNYNNPDILKVITELKNKYLLSEPKQKDADSNIIRLSHDSLAPLIRELYSKSNLPGQRASRLLKSKQEDIEGDYEVEFSKPDLAIIDAGKYGMGKWTNKETKVIEKSRQRIKQYNLELEEKNKQLEIALKEAQEQTLQAKAKALAATARQMLQTDPTIAFRLAEAACKITTVATKEAQSAFVDILGQNLPFYKSMEGYIAAFSPCGKYILTGNRDNTARLWNLDGTLKHSFEGHNDLVTSIAFSPNGKFILTGSYDKTAKLWNLDGTMKHSFEGHNDLVTSVAFSPNGKFILTGSCDETAKLWNLDGTSKQSLGHYDEVTSVAFSPNGKFILTASGRKKELGRVWDGSNEAILWNFDGTSKQSFRHTDLVMSVTFSPNGKFILTGSCDNTATLWNLSGTMKQSFKGHSGLVTSTAFSSDGKFILTGSEDCTARLWNLDGTLERSFKGHSSGIGSVAFSPNGKAILTGSMDKTARLWNLQGSLKQSFKGDNDPFFSVYSVDFSPDDKLVLIGGGGGGNGTAKLWNLDGILKQSFEGHTEEVTSIAFSLDGNFILSGSGDATAKLWNLDGTLKQSFEEFTHSVSSVAFSPGGKLILTGSYDKTARLWNLDGTLKHSFEGHNEFVTSVAFSQDGMFIATGSKDSMAKLWNLSGVLNQCFKGHASEVTSAAFSPDGKVLLTGSKDNTARLWNLNGTVKQSFEGHASEVNSVGFSPDGKFILTGSTDRTAKLWDLNGALKQSFNGHTSKVTSVNFSRNGKFLLTGSEDKTAKLWLPFWEIIKPENTYVLTSEQMTHYDIPANIEWGEIW